MRTKKDRNEKAIAAFRAQGRPIFACHIQHIDAEWHQLRKEFIGARWSDTGGNHPDMTIYFSPAASYGTKTLEELKNKYNKFLLGGK